MNMLFVRQLGRCNWKFVSDAMFQFTEKRNKNTVDEVWLVEHYPIFTQGKASNSEHILMPGNIPVLKSNRGGQVTYHGPGQQLMYILVDIIRRKIRIHELINIMEDTVIDTLAKYNIHAVKRKNAPGVYVGTDKICSLGLHIHKGCSSHGLALNVNMELTPFLRINPCGHPGMRMIQVSQFKPDITLNEIQPFLIHNFAYLAGFTRIKWLNETII